MIKFGTTLHTNGTGYWSSVAKEVKCSHIGLPYVSEDQDFGELRVYFDLNSWNPDNDGLIYTDKMFINELRSKLNEIGFAGNDVDYSEQGMQGDNYVSLDVGEEFIKRWFSIIPEYR